MNTFKCFLDQETKDCFIEIGRNNPIEYFTKSTLINLLDMAEQQGAKRIFACFEKDTKNI